MQQGARVAETNDLEPLADKWRAFGWDVAEVDGHDPVALLAALDAHAARGKPLCIIAHTIKGKGVSFMEDQVGWHHGVPNRPQFEQAVEGAGVHERRRRLARRPVRLPRRLRRDADRARRGDARIVAVVNDSVGSCKLGGFRKRGRSGRSMSASPSRTWSASAPGSPTAARSRSSAPPACFLTGRALEQIKADVAYSNANVKLCGMSPGMAYGELGPTHHSIEDFALAARDAPNLAIVVAGRSLRRRRKRCEAAAAHDGPVFLRISRTSACRR